MQLVKKSGDSIPRRKSICLAHALIRSLQGGDISNYEDAGAESLLGQDLLELLEARKHLDYSFQQVKVERADRELTGGMESRVS